MEVAFAARNLEGVGYAPVRILPFQGMLPNHKEVARNMPSDRLISVENEDTNASNIRNALSGR